MTPTDPEQPRPESEAGDSAPQRPDAPLSFVPHEADGGPVHEPVRIRTSRYGDLDEHQLVHLLDSIEDERARSRFRESVYISLFFWIVVAWLVLYGPKYLWHAPKLVTPFEVLHQRELTQLNLPSLHAPPPSAPRPAPKLDNHTLEHLRSMEPPPPRAATPRPESPKVAPAPPAPSIANAMPPAPAPALPLPNAPQPTPRTTPPVVAEAPTPQPSAKPNFNTNSNAESSIEDAMRNAARNPGGGGAMGRGALGSGAEILSDTQGVDFSEYLIRLKRATMHAWLPLLPAEVEPPLSKTGVTDIIVTILPDGTIGDMKLAGSTHDDAINRAAWGSIVSQGKLPSLPKDFHGPNVIIRITFTVNENLPNQ
jgi:outer membrane biosynthesis protein TonB